MLRTVQATRYVTPLREGGSLPAIVEADDLGLYVVKFRGAGQGLLALIAELVAGEIGRLLGIGVPELVFVQVDEALGRNEPDEEICDLLRASVGLNLGLDYLPGSVMFDIAAGDAADAETASKAVWFDAFVTNVDRTAHNPNLLCWHKSLYFIDHGAALYFHHNWATREQMSRGSFPLIRKHLLLRWASRIQQVNEEVRPLLGESALTRILEFVPDEWLITAFKTDDARERRSAYLEYFVDRLLFSQFATEAQRAHAELF